MSNNLKSTVMFCKREVSNLGRPFFTAFYPNAFCVHLHDSKAAILKVQVTEDPSTDRHDTYWGWWDAEDNKFLFVWADRMLLNMCFAYGMQAEEDRGRGKGMPVTIEVLEEGVAHEA